MNVNKELEKYRTKKMIDQVLNSPEYKKANEERENEIFLNAYVDIRPAFL